MTTSRPSCREDFEIAIICALPLEYDAVVLLFDEFWDDDGDNFGRAVNDENTYRTGRIGKHSVVLALLPGMGKVNAAAAVASMRSSYENLRLVLLVGICGGAPYHNKDEILLGDVVISKSVIQYDFGRQYPDGFVRRDKADGDLSKQNKNIRTLLATFETDLGRDNLRKKTAYFLSQLQAKAGNNQTKYNYPGTVEDKLFKSSYRHKHHITPECICSNCHRGIDPVCSGALVSPCHDLGCDDEYLIERSRLVAKRELEQANNNQAQGPAIYVGTVASGDKVMKSGEDRDKIAQKEGAIAFEMEAAGAWEEVPCMVVKGVCDYADCHKNKKWQDFAAATAASASKAILERYIQKDPRSGRVSEKPQSGHFLVPFGRNSSFVGREAILLELLERIWPGTNKDDCQRTAIEGLGGVGKTQIALEVVYRVHDKHPDCSVFWVPVVDAKSFENAYRSIGKQMKIKGIDKDGADVKQLVKAACSDESSGSWLLVIDNADDIALLFGANSLLDYLPFSRKGSILFTTRNHKVATKLDISPRDIIAVAEMDDGEALSLLRKGLKQTQASDSKSTKRLLGLLANLPLAIRQASAYMAQNEISALEYLELYESEPKDMIDMLGKNFEDRHRYTQIQNPVAATWIISFNHISQQDQLAAEYLRFMSLLAEKDIPRSLLPTVKKGEAVGAIGTLKAYAFITQREGRESFDMHRLVRLAMQNWLEEKKELKGCVMSAIKRLNQVFPFPRHENRNVWMKYLPHAMSVIELREHFTDKKVEARSFRNVAVSQSIRLALRLYRKVPVKSHEHSTEKEIEANLFTNVAMSHYHLGQYQTAEQMHRQAYELDKATLSKDHPNLHASINNLASALDSLGRHKEAEQMYQQVLKLVEKALGKDHPNTLACMSNLATTLGNLGRYNEAEQMHLRTLKLYKQVLGEDNSDTLTSMSNLANVLYDLGRYKEAEQMHLQTLKLRERELGKDHPHTLATMSDLANAVSSLGRYNEAEQMHRRIVKLCERELGKDHPHTLATMSDLANALSSLGRYNEAEQMHRRTVKLSEQTLGKGHVTTLTSMNDLVHMLGCLGKYDEAEPMSRQTLKLCEQTLGKGHLTTLNSMNNLALVLACLGKYDEAEPMSRQTLELREQALGRGHPDTQKIRRTLEACVRAMRRGEVAT